MVVCAGSQVISEIAFLNVSFAHIVGQELPYESQYASSGTGLFADYSCSSDYYLLFPCNTTSSCQSYPLVVNCVQGKESHFGISLFDL